MTEHHAYYENAKIDDIEDRSVSGYQVMRCPLCGKTVTHYIIGYSTKYGLIWLCSECLREHP